MMIKRVLLFLLLASGVVTVATGASIILDIQAFAARFAIDLNVPPETALAIATLGTPIAASSLFTFLAAFWVLTDHPGARSLALVCGLMLVTIGIGIYFISGITQLLYMDSLRGLIVMAFAYLYHPHGAAHSSARVTGSAISAE